MGNFKVFMMTSSLRLGISIVFSRNTERKVQSMKNSFCKSVEQPFIFKAENCGQLNKSTQPINALKRDPCFALNSLTIIGIQDCMY